MVTIEKLRASSYTTEVASVSQSIVEASKSGDWSSDAYLTETLSSLVSKTKFLLSAINRSKALSD